MGIIRCGHSLDDHFTGRRHHERIQMTGQRGFAAPVRSDDRREGSLHDLGRHVLQGIERLAVLCLERVGQVTDVEEDFPFSIFPDFFIHLSSFSYSTGKHYNLTIYNITEARHYSQPAAPRLINKYFIRFVLTIKSSQTSCRRNKSRHHRLFS